MICPNCMTHIPDDSLRCPACHASIDATILMPRLMGTWCPSCAAMIAEGQDVCPSCGFPIEPEWGSKGEEEVTAPNYPIPVPELMLDTEVTRAMPRIESAIPQDPETPGAIVEKDPMPHTRVFLLASIASALLICGLALVLSHPWAPGRRSIGATEEADTSMAGYPGRVSSLKGQDGRGEVPEVIELSGDQATYNELSAAYTKLGELSASVDANDARFEELAYSSDPTERANGSGEVETLAIETSNVIDKISRVDTSSGTYVEDVGHLTTLGNWLRNRIDTLRGAWAASVAAQDPQAARQEIEAARSANRDSSGQSAYAVLFAENYPSWEPQPPSE